MLFLEAVGGCVDDKADGQQVHDFLEGDVLLLHLLPDGPGGLGALLVGDFDAGFGELPLDGDEEGVQQLLALGGGGFQLVVDLPVFLRLGAAEEYVLELGLDAVESQLMGNGDVQEHGLGMLRITSRRSAILMSMTLGSRE